MAFEESETGCRFDEGVSSDDREAWMDARQRLVTASDCAALLGANEYKTRDQLRLEKAGLVEVFEGNEYTEWALALEPLIIERAAIKFGWQIVKHGRLVVDKECPLLGATPDAVVRSPWSGLAQLKVTCVKPYEQVKKYDGQPPLAYQVQCCVEMAVTGAKECRLVVLHTFPRFELREYPVPRHEALIQRIRREVPVFWAEVEALKAGKMSVT